MYTLNLGFLHNLQGQSLVLALNSSRKDDSLNLDRMLFHILDPTREVSVPYLTVRTLLDLNFVSFLKECRFLTIQKHLSFISSGSMFTFNWKVSAVSIF